MSAKNEIRWKLSLNDKKHFCIIESPQDIIFDETLLIVHKKEANQLMDFLLEDSQNNTSKFQLSKLSQSQDIKSKPVTSPRRYISKDSRLPDDYSYISGDQDENQFQEDVVQDNESGVGPDVSKILHEEKIFTNEIESLKFTTCSELDEYVKFWASKKKFVLINLNGEKYLIKEQCYQRSFYCNQK